MLVEKSSILYKTKQAWKYRQLVWTAAATLTISVLSYTEIVSWFENFDLRLILVAICASSLAVTLSIRCPVCREYWWWRAMKAPIRKNELINVITQEWCYSCGYVGDSVSEHDHAMKTRMGSAKSSHGDS